MANPYDVYVVCNTTKQPYDVIYNSQFYGHLEPGGITSIFQFVAVNVVKALVDTMIFESGKDDQLSNVKLRQQYIKGIVLEVKRAQETVPVERYQKAKMENLKYSDDLDMFEKMDKKVESPLVNPPPELRPPTPPVSIENPPEMPTPEPIQTIQNDIPVDQTPTNLETNGTEPTREMLYKKASDDFGIDFNDQKTKEACDAKSIDELKAEFKWGV